MTSHRRSISAVLRVLASIGVIVAIVALIVALSAASARHERARLLDEFTTATRRQVHASAEVLAARLDALDQDTRVLTDQVEQSRQSAEHNPELEHRVSETAFRALAIAIPHYRIISLNRRDGSV